MTQKRHLNNQTGSSDTNAPQLSSNIMMFRSKSRDDDETEDVTVSGTLPFPKQSGDYEEEEESTLIKTVGWISAGLGAVALGLFIGRELRQRYRFNHRTPYDFYAHSGDEQDVDFGLGI
jgi:hypothetical protein